MYEILVLQTSGSIQLTMTRKLVKFIPNDRLERFTEIVRKAIRCIISTNDNLEAGDLIFGSDIGCEFDYGIFLWSKGGCN